MCMWGTEGWRGEAGCPGLQSLQELRTGLGYLESEKYLCVSFPSYTENQIFIFLFFFFRNTSCPGLLVAGQTVF